MTEAGLLAKRADYKTNHILHLLLSILTAGMWFLVWAIVAAHNADKRREIDKKLSYLNG